MVAMNWTILSRITFESRCPDTGKRQRKNKNGCSDAGLGLL